MTNNFEQENVKSVIPAYEPESTISNTWMPGRARHDKRRSFTPIEPFDKLRASSRQSFTLIELLVVLALVAILSVVVVMTLNPAELLKQARDSNRLSDLATINTALNLFSTDVTSGFMGTSTVVYVSLPSTTSNCSNLGLPSLPTGYTYNCVTSQNLRNTDGTGWIPVNFNRISSNSPISQLPIDPINTTSTGNYYTYVTGGSWAISSMLESQKYLRSSAATDGGNSFGKLEIGNNLSLISQSDGLAGWWDFEEGGGGVGVDKSGNGNDGVWYGSGSHYSAGKTGLFSANFNGFAFGDYLNMGKRISLDSWAGITYGAWFKTSYSGGVQDVMNEWAGGANFAIRVATTGKIDLYLPPVGWNNAIGSGNLIDGFWHQAYVTYGGGFVKLYIDGDQIFSTSAVSFGGANLKFKIGANANLSDVAGCFFKGQIDDAKIYSRGLSSAEIQAAYNATK